MSDVTYKVEFELTEGATETQEATQTIDKNVLPKTQPTKRGFIEKKAAKQVMMLYGVYKIASAMVETQRINDMTMRGDNLAAKMHQEKIARRDKAVGSLFSFGMGFAVKGKIGGIMIAMEAIKIANEAISISMENRNLIRQSQQEKYINQFEQARFVRNTTTESIRW